MHFDCELNNYLVSIRKKTFLIKTYNCETKNQDHHYTSHIERENGTFINYANIKVTVSACL